MIHELKTHSEYYQQVIKGNKTFEVRKNDRGFKLGDTLKLIEVNEKTLKPTGATAIYQITYIFQGGNYGVSPEYVILAIRPGIGNIADVEDMSGAAQVSDWQYYTSKDMD